MIFCGLPKRTLEPSQMGSGGITLPEKALSVTRDCLGVNCAFCAAVERCND